MMVEGGGFEPPKAEPTDLQSVPFGHSGTPPSITEADILDDIYFLSMFFFSHFNYPPRLQ